MQQFILPRPHGTTALVTPLELPNLAAWYSLADSPGDSTYRIDGSNRVMLVADRSGNSAVNGLVLPAVNGNYASAPDSAALSITGDIDVRANLMLPTWTPSGSVGVLGKFIVAGNQRSYLLVVDTSGKLILYASTAGIADNGVTSSVATGFAAYSTNWIRAVRVAATGVVTFYTSSDGVTWSQLGTTGAGTSGNIFDSSAALEIGAYNNAASGAMAGIIYRAQIYNGIAGTLAFDANFSTPAKLATTLTESSSNAATVTINQTAIALPARICGARDLTQNTQAYQPIFSVSNGYNIATFDGSNDYMKSAPFSLSQPESVYFTGSQETWTAGDTLFDGNGVNSGHLQQDTLTPRLRAYAGASLAQISPTLGQKSIFTTIFNGASSSIRWNRNAAVTGNAGTSAMNGFTLAVTGDNLSTFANITWSESLIRSAADDAATQLRLANYLIRKWGISA